MIRNPAFIIPAFMIRAGRTREMLSGIPLSGLDDPGRDLGEDPTLDRSIREPAAPIECVFRAAPSAQGESFL